MKDIMILVDGNQIEIEDGSSIRNITHISETEEDALATIAKLTNENVKHVKFSNDGNVYGEYDNMIMTARPVRQEEEEEGELTGRIIITFGLRELTDIEKRLASLETSQTDIQVALAEVYEMIV